MIGKTEFQTLGGFDCSFVRAAAEDRDLCIRATGAGYSLLYVPEAKIYHAHYLTGLTFWKQHFNYGRGAFWLRQRRSHPEQRNVKIEPLSFYLKLCTYPFSQCSGLSGILLMGLMILTQVSHTLGFFWEWGQCHLKMTLLRARLS